MHEDRKNKKSKVFTYKTIFKFRVGSLARPNKTLTGLVVFVLVFTWLFSGWPQIFNFPPKIEEAQAAWGVPKIGSPVTALSGNVTLTEPSGIAQGDLMIAAIAYRSNAVFTLPLNWTLVATQQSSGDTDATNGIASGLMAYIIRGVSAPSLVFTRTGGDQAIGRIIAYSGVNQSSPYDTGSANTLSSASTTVTTGTITTAEPGELIVAMMSGGDAYTSSAFDAATDPSIASGATDTSTAPTNGTWLERADSSYSGGADGNLAMADAIRETNGATGTMQVTASGSARSVMIAGAFKQAQSFEQSGYRFFENSGTTSVSNVLADANTAATTASVTSQFRLRMLVHVALQLSSSGESLKLQYATKVDSTCADDDASNESWADVTTSSTGIAYNDNGGVLDGDTLTENASDDPTHSGHTKVIQTYEEVNNFTNSVAAIPATQDGLWDFSLKWNSASSNTSYCLKAVKSSDGSALNTYTQYPEISTPADYTLNQLNYRWRNDNGVENGAAQTIYLHPTSQGTDTGLTVTAGCTNDTTEWDCANDQTSNAGTGDPSAGDGNTSYLSAAGALKSSFNLDNDTIPSGSTISQLEIFMRARETTNSGTGPTFREYYILGGSPTACATNHSHEGTTYTLYSCTFSVSMSTTDLNNLQIGAENTVNDFSVTQVYVLVTYTAGTEATWKEDTNTPHANQAKNEKLRLRVLLKNDGPDPTGALNHRLQFAREGSGSCASPEFSYAAVPATTGEVIRATTSYYANQDTSSDVSGAIGNPSGTFVSGKLVEDPDNDALSVDLASGEFTEHEYAIQFTTDATDGATYCFRVVKNNTAFTGTYSYAEITLVGGGGALTVDIVDGSGNSVSSPSVSMGAISLSFIFQTASGTFGVSSQKIRVDNGTGSAQWTLTLAADAGPTAFWDDASADYDFNDPTANAGDGGDSDSLGGQMTVDASVGSISPEAGCNTTGLTLGSSAGFSEGATNSITLLTAGASAGTGCYWDITDVDISQTVPAEQPTGSYSIDMTLTVTAS